MIPALYRELVALYGEDVAQETAIRLWQHPEVHNETHWCRKVARNLAMTAHRQDHRVCPVEDARIPERLDPSNPLARVESLQLVRRIAQQVSPKLVKEAVTGQQVLSRQVRWRLRTMAQALLNKEG